MDGWLNGVDSWRFFDIFVDWKCWFGGNDFIEINLYRNFFWLFVIRENYFMWFEVDDSCWSCSKGY